MPYIAAADPSQIPSGTMHAVTVGGQKLLLANVQGSFFAITAVCPHLGADLCKGKLTGSIVTCPRHGAAFDVVDGHAVEAAKIVFLKMKTKAAASFAVKVEGGQVLIDV